jgi:hypothetical protein
MKSKVWISSATSFFSRSSSFMDPVANVSKTIILSLSLSFLMLSGCAKKEESTRSSTSRMSPTAGATGARSVNPSGSQAALDAAAAQGVASFHIESISAPVAAIVSGYDAIQVRGVLNFNNQTFPFVTTHDRIQDVTVSFVQQMRSGDFLVELQGICSDAQCSSYYAVINVYKGQSPVVQLLQKQSFMYGTSQNTSNYFSGSQFVTSITQVFQILGAPYGF